MLQLWFRREVWLSCLWLAVVLHVCLFLFHVHVVRLLPRPIPKTEEKEKDESLRFIIIDDAVPDPEPPKEAEREAAVAQRARDMADDVKPETDAPFSEGTTVVETQEPQGTIDAGAAPVPEQPQPEPPAAQQPQAVAQTPPEPVKPPEPKQPEVKPVAAVQPAKTVAAADILTEMAEEKITPAEQKVEPVATPAPVAKPVETPPPAAPTQRTTPRPVFKPIGTVAGTPGATPTASVASSAVLKGNKAFETLMARYPEYMRQVGLKLHRALNAQQTIQKRSYHAGEISLAFGISKEGTLSKLDIIQARTEMTEEQALSINAVKNAAPFPPLTDEMVKDIALFSDIGLHVYFQ